MTKFKATYDRTNHLEVVTDDGTRLEIKRGRAGDGDYIYLKLYPPGGYVHTARFTLEQWDTVKGLICGNDFVWESGW